MPRQTSARRSAYETRSVKDIGLSASTTSPGTSQIAVLICSSDSRLDILERVLPSILKYWPDCPYPIYVGTNSPQTKWPHVTALIAKSAGWREECLSQVAQIEASHLIVVLDDFLFQAPVNQAALSEFTRKAVQDNLPYLRLLPLGKSLKQRLTATARAEGSDIQRLEDARPFYSCLQIALWEKHHFASLLKLKGSIWEFEHQHYPGVSHYAVVGPSPFLYRHIVEKGRWLPDARKLLGNAGLSVDLGRRPIWSKWQLLRTLFDHLRFFVLGYANH